MFQPLEIAVHFDGVTVARDGVSILDHVSRLVPSDVLELKLWSEERHALVPYRFQQPSSGRVVTASLSQFGSLTNQLMEQRKPFKLDNARAEFS